MSAGRLRVQLPSGPPFFSERSSVFRAPGLGPGGRRRKFCRSDHSKLLPWSNTSGIRLLNGTMQVGILPAAPFSGCRLQNYTGCRFGCEFLADHQLETRNLKPVTQAMPGSVKVARRPVKPFGVGASPTLAANSQGVMSAADGLVRNEEVAGATPAPPMVFIIL